MYSLPTLFKKLMHNNKVLPIAAVLLITTMLVSVGFTAKLNVSAQPGSMATLQKILATYAVSIVPGALKEIAHIITFHQQLPFPQYYSRMV